jgi:hypothetical protein
MASLHMCTPQQSLLLLLLLHMQHCRPRALYAGRCLARCLQMT